MSENERADDSGGNAMALKPITQIFERTMVAVEQIEKQLDDSSTRLDEVLEEVRAQSQAIFILIIGYHRHEICQDEANEAKSVVCAIRT